MTNLVLILILAALLFGGGAVLSFLKDAALVSVAFVVLAVIALIAASLIKSLWGGLKEVREATEELVRYLATNPLDALYRAGLIFWFPYRLTYLAVIDLRSDETKWDRFLSCLSVFLGLIFSSFWLVLTGAWGLIVFMYLSAIVGFGPGERFWQ